MPFEQSIRRSDQAKRNRSAEDGHRRHTHVLHWQDWVDRRSHRPEDDHRHTAIRCLQISHRGFAGVQSTVTEPLREKYVRIAKPDVCPKELNALTSALLIL